MAQGPLDFWIDWANQIGVLLSLFFQVVLHLFANVRRRSSSIWLRVPLWLAYQLSDMTATYTAGQLLYSSCAPQDHQLIAFWAAFLLLHLGGPDNITAYAIEDNKLWTRHFLTLVVQVLGAGYVFYKYIAGTGIFFMLAAILIFVVGVAKYAERTCALWFANFSSLQSSLKVLARDKHRQYFYIENQKWCKCSDLEEDELVLQRAHSLFLICKRGIVDSVIVMNPGSQTEVDSEEIKIIKALREKPVYMWRVMEMELSLMYDILYTKAIVTHSWVGYGIRVISPLAVAASLVLFHLSSKDSYSRVDVDITYTLLGGALVLETKSLLGALGSSWALAFLCCTQWDWLRHSTLCNGRWRRLRRALTSLRRSWPCKMIMTGTTRKWSGTIGQHNMLRFRAGQMDQKSRLLGNLFRMLGLGEWWDRRYYSCTIIVPEKVVESAQRLTNWISRDDINTMGMLRHKWGEVALNHNNEDLFKNLNEYYGVDFHESIIIWHIATDLILAKREADPQVETVRALSNYMMFLLVNRPYMLPGLPQNWLYKQTCNNLDEVWDLNHSSSDSFCTVPCNHSSGDNFYTVLKKFFQPRQHWNLKFSSLEKELAKHIRKKLDDHTPSDSENPRLKYARKIALIIEGTVAGNKVDLLLNLWVDFLGHAANRCSRESHARKLSSGGEFTTIVWLMIEHLRQIKKK
ncbi:hypothetical protein QYE76_023036 [Lolium multiflorum]|uniref:DUF4220 domain-containing protein n=1 Tax=Lolium multiflorum TaxID=4521 RepID=A0AAD8RDP9_LOLMU|nr:hypothetical protein QYE76_023036 [Lolium multiflorum]